jgi:hypothetical protein
MRAEKDRHAIRAIVEKAHVLRLDVLEVDEDAGELHGTSPSSHALAGFGFVRPSSPAVSSVREARQWPPASAVASPSLVRITIGWLRLPVNR